MSSAHNAAVETPPKDDPAADWESILAELRFKTESSFRTIEMALTGVISAIDRQSPLGRDLWALRTYVSDCARLMAEQRTGIPAEENRTIN